MQASQWQLSKGVDLSVGVIAAQSDSVDSDDEEDSTDRTITVSPFIAASRQSRRLSFTGRAGFVIRDTRSEPDAEVEPEASLEATGVLLDDTLWLDSSGRASRRLVGSNTIVDDVLTDPDDAVEVYQFSIGPRWEQDLSRTTRAEGAYRYALVDGSGDEVAGSDAHLVNLGLLQSLGNGRTRVGLRLEAQRTNFDTGGSSRAEDLIAGLSYDFRRNLTGRLVLGRDRLRITTQEFDEQGTVYGAGITWRPLRQLFIDAEYQERVFGSRPAVSIGLQGRVSSVELSWSRRLVLPTVLH